MKFGEYYIFKKKGKSSNIDEISCQALMFINCTLHLTGMQEQAAAASPISPARPLPRRLDHPLKRRPNFSRVFPCGKGDEDRVSHPVAKADLAVVGLSLLRALRQGVSGGHPRSRLSPGLRQQGRCGCRRHHLRGHRERGRGNRFFGGA